MGLPREAGIREFLKLGVAAAKCKLTAVASGPIGLCGAIGMKCASAIAAILRISSSRV